MEINTMNNLQKIYLVALFTMLNSATFLQATAPVQPVTTTQTQQQEAKPNIIEKIGTEVRLAAEHIIHFVTLKFHNFTHKQETKSAVAATKKNNSALRHTDRT